MPVFSFPHTWPTSLISYLLGPCRQWNPPPCTGIGNITQGKGGYSFLFVGAPSPNSPPVNPKGHFPGFDCTVLGRSEGKERPSIQTPGGDSVFILDTGPGDLSLLWKECLPRDSGSRDPPWAPEGPGGWGEGSNWRLPFVEPSEPAVCIFQVVIASKNLPDNKAIRAKTVREYLKIRDIIQCQSPPL